ncbi:MAG: hypothetical protein EXR92_06800 [Gemmatimonadetes bacterium]|nr:hypothetical protein [Gemmatimonadota bacterium]
MSNASRRLVLRTALSLGSALLLAGGARPTAGQEVHDHPEAPAQEGGMAEMTAPMAPSATNRERYQLPAVWVERGPEIDGFLNDEVWGRAALVDEFVQQEPREGAAASERTEVRVLYDGASLFLGVLALDSSPGSVAATDMRRDGTQILNEDNFEVILDTFMDSRSAYMFVVSPLGAMLDQQVFEEGEGRQGSSSNVNREWDGVWEASAHRTPEGWTAEIRIPMVTLRFPDSNPQSWGINFMRSIAHKNEVVFWAPIPRAFALTRVSLAGTLTGLDSLDRGRDLRLKPYVAAGGRSTLSEGVSDRSGQRDVGLDVKYGVTASLNLDMTINTDFAQAEADNEQVNLTRFPLFFPEKRDFFLENAGQFNVATAGDGQRADLFFSRQIGILDSGERVPIVAGARLTGKVGQNNIAAMGIQTEDTFGQPGENFLVARYSRDILSRSKVGGLVTNRQSTSGGDYNGTYAMDATFALGSSVTINGFLAQTQTSRMPSGEGRGGGGYLRASWLTRAWYIYLDHTDLGDNFNAELGYVPRVGVRTTKVHFERTPRPDRWRIRLMQPMWNVTYTTDQTGRLVDRRLHHMVRVTFDNSANLTVIYNRDFERLDSPFRVRGISIAPGDYFFYDANIAFNSNPSRRISYGIAYQPMGYYDGKRKDLSLNLGSRITSQLSGTVRYTRNDVNLPGGAFVAEVGAVRMDYTFSPALSLQALTQYNSSSEQWSTSARLRYSYRPGSDLYVVYDEVRRDIAGIPVAEEFRDRQLIVKATYLLSL